MGTPPDPHHYIQFSEAGDGIHVEFRNSLTKFFFYIYNMQTWVKKKKCKNDPPLLSIHTHNYRSDSESHHGSSQCFYFLSMTEHYIATRRRLLWRHSNSWIDFVIGMISGGKACKINVSTHAPFLTDTVHHKSVLIKGRISCLYSEMEDCWFLHIMSGNRRPQF